MAGDTTAVWERMRARSQYERRHYEPVIGWITPTDEDAWWVATETMKRVRHNLELLVPRLADIGYECAAPTPWTPPTRDAYQEVGEWEEKRGPLPLSIRAFFMIAAESLDLSPRIFPEGDNYAQPESQLGYCDPLVVHALDGENTRWDTRYERRKWHFAPDEYFKANVSGAGSFGWFLPDAGADARIIGQDDGNRNRPGEWFVDYLRHAFSGGCFRGYPAGDDGTKAPPTGREIEHLRQGFLLL